MSPVLISSFDFVSASLNVGGRKEEILSIAKCDNTTFARVSSGTQNLIYCEANYACSVGETTGTNTVSVTSSQEQRKLCSGMPISFQMRATSFNITVIQA